MVCRAPSIEATSRAAGADMTEIASGVLPEGAGLSRVRFAGPYPGNVQGLFGHRWHRFRLITSTGSQYRGISLFWYGLGSRVPWNVGLEPQTAWVRPLCV